MRVRHQLSEPSAFEAFDVSRLRDTLERAVGVPQDRSRWGSNISGRDALVLSFPLAFNQLGTLCQRIETAHKLEDYKDNFDWIDYIKPISDPQLLNQLQALVLTRLGSDDLSRLNLAPPEIVDWDQVAGFRFHYNRPQGPAHSAVTHSDLRLVDYLAGLRQVKDLDTIDAEYLRQKRIFVLDGDGAEQYHWTVWQCLVGEIQLGTETFILDEGEFFEVRRDYLGELNQFINAIPIAVVDLPDTTPTMREGEYNQLASQASDDLILLDRRLVRISNRTTPIEICDLVSRSRQLIHVKRHLGSADLSHLFAQGVVSADLLQTSPEFRTKAADQLSSAASNRAGFGLINTDTFLPSEWEVVYAIAERWSARSMASALPFFSKINLREATSNLRARGFKVAVRQIEARLETKRKASPVSKRGSSASSTST